MSDASSAPRSQLAATRRVRAHLSKVDPVMGALMRAVGPYRLVPDLECTPFRALARAIAHQQLNGAVATRILERFCASLGRDGAFPDPEAVLAAPDEQLRAVGFSFAKIAALRDLAAKTVENVVPARSDLAVLSDAEIIERVTQVRGIGRWTVEMMLMFQLARPDVLPVDDFGVRNGFRLAYGLRGLPTPRALAEYGERWAPHRTAAAWYLWRACDLAKAGELPAPPLRTRIALAQPRKVPAARRGVRAKPGLRAKPGVRKPPPLRRAAAPRARR